jgi:N-acetylglucosamine malate deacetylase 1
MRSCKQQRQLLQNDSRPFKPQIECFPMKLLTRRKLLENSLVLGSGALGLAGTDGQAVPVARKPKILVAGAHPDDPESGCGGTIARLTDSGHDVVILYLTRGERGISGKSYAEAGAIRTGEAHKACEILKARPVFAGQVNGKVEVTYDRYMEYRQILESENPDVVFTHWPIDSHEDHRANSLLVYNAWLEMNRKFTLFYFEVETGAQTQNFHPTLYVDITTTEARKRAACFAHASQDPAGFYALHDMMNRFRGMEFRCPKAEAFIRHEQSPDVALLPPTG